MYQYFFKMSFRNITKQGIFPVINILSLSIGLSVVLLISILIFNERSFDKSFKESKHIYRINAAMSAFMPGETYCSVGNAVGPDVQEAIPEILTTVRTYSGQFFARINDQFMKENITWADEDFFRLFDTPFIHGDPHEALTRPNTLAISEKMSQKLFGDKNPVGEIISLNNQLPVEISAVYKDYPENSSFAGYQAVTPFKYGWVSESIHWGNIDFETFCLLTEHADTASVNAQMREVRIKKVGEGWFYMPKLQRLDEIHLYSAKYHHTFTHARSDIGKVNMLSLLAVIILIVACFNYMNLSTARAQKRSKEIGVSKTLGAKRSELIIRLLLETAMLTFVSFVFAFLLAYILLPFFNNILNEQLNFGLVFHAQFLLSALLVWLLTTIFAASYPAIYLSGFPPLLAIRKATVGSSHVVIRKVLTVGQFVIAIVLIAWVFIIWTQIQYVNNKNIGFNPHNLVGVWISQPEESKLEALANDFRTQHFVQAVSREQSFLFSGSGNTLSKDAEDKHGINLFTISADSHFIDLMQLKIIAGTDLPERVPGDSVTQMVLNRKAVEYMETTPEEIIGKTILASIGSPVVKVCGVVENFHFRSLHRPVEGFGIHNQDRDKKYIMLRVHEGDFSEQLKTLEQIFKNHFPDEMFDPAFPDMELQRAYEAEQRTSRIAICFSILAIFVACLGVFGLTAFMAEQRTQEIGIRKVMGASIANIVSLFTNNYLKLLLIALVIAIPIAWWVGHRYLQDFAYHTSLTWWIFVSAALITVALTLFTVCSQAIKAALASPVKSIKTE